MAGEPWDLNAMAGAPTQIFLAGEARATGTPDGMMACVVEPDATQGAWELRRSVLYDGDWYAIDRAHHRRFFLGAHLSWPSAYAAFAQLAGDAGDAA